MLKKYTHNGFNFYLPQIYELEDKIKFNFTTEEFELKEDIFFRIFGISMILPKGLTSDGASIPLILQPILGISSFDYRIIFPAIIHDYLYRTQFIDKQIADRIFYELLQLSLTKTKSWIIYKGVALFGFIAWRTNSKNKLRFPEAKNNLNKAICNGYFNINK